jgi:hypothetical protein
MVRVAVAVAALLALAACNKASVAKKAEEAASSAAASPTTPAAAPAPAHRWTYKNGVDYGYIDAEHKVVQPGAPAPETTVFRYLGVQDGVYTVIELEGGAVVAASCAKPCQQVRLRGQDLDQTLALSPDSTVAAALADAMAGQLEIYHPPETAAAKP